MRHVGRDPYVPVETFAAFGVQPAEYHTLLREADVVDEAALARALETGQIAAAGLDVFEDEPLAADSPLRRLGDRVLQSPHIISSNVGSGLKLGIEWAARSVLSALRGEVPDNVFNTGVIPRGTQRFAGRAGLSSAATATRIQ
ncbi:MAG: hypothetical protein LC797_03250 [Chloroflexi bacterium]|nr:hypothetical protein [Chloroflexota bacterium]